MKKLLSTICINIFAMLVLALLPLTPAKAAGIEVETFAELEEALEDDAYDTVILTSTLSLKRYAYELDLNGKTLTVAQPYVNTDGTLNDDATSMTMFSVYSSLTISNGTIIGPEGMVFDVRGTLYMDNCDISSALCAVSLSNDSSLALITNTDIHNISTSNMYDGAISAFYGTVILDGCKIYDCHNPSGSGACLYSFDSDYYVNNCLIACNATSTDTAIYLYEGNGYFMNSTIYGNIHHANECIRFGNKEMYVVNCDFTSNYLTYTSDDILHSSSAHATGKPKLIRSIYSFTLTANMTATECVAVDNTTTGLYSAYTGDDVTYPALSSKALHGSVMATAGVYATYFNYDDPDDVKMAYRLDSESDSLKALGSCSVGGDLVDTYIDGSKRIPFSVGAVALNSSHSFTYSLQDNQILATCSDSSCEFNSEPLTLSVSSLRSSYTGEAVAAKISDSFTAITGESYTLNYKSSDGGSYNSSEAPTEIGQYTVTLTYKGLSVTGSLEIMNSTVIWVGGKTTKTESTKVLNLDLDYLAELGLNTDIGSNKYICAVTGVGVDDIDDVFNVTRGTVNASVKNQAATARYDTKNSKLIITAGKTASDVTVKVWIAEYQKKNAKEGTSAAIESYACITVTVKVAPTKLEAQIDGVKASKAYLGIGDTLTFTLVPTAGKSTVSVDATYTVEVQKSEYSSLVEITDNEDGTYTIKALSLLNSKLTKVPIVCTNVESGKKYTIQLTLENRIKTISPVAAILTDDGEIKLAVPESAKKTASRTVSLIATNSDKTSAITATTDKLAFYVVTTTEEGAGYTLSSDCKKFTCTAKSSLVSASYTSKTGLLTIRLQKTVTTDTPAKLLIVVTKADNTKTVYEYPICFTSGSGS